MIESLQKLGISTLVTRDINSRVNDENLALALGGMTRGTTPLDITAAYAAIANDGVYTKPIFVKRIETSTGSLVYEAKAETHTVATAQEAYIMKSMLQDAVNRGTGARGRISGQAVAGKTGTTNDDKDIWFVGFTPYYTGAVWIGEDLPKSLNSTSDVPTALWGKIMTKVHSDLASKSFTMPSGIVGLAICDESGLQVGPYCSKTRKELFIAGTTPKEVCTKHEPPEEVEDPDDNPLLDDENENQAGQATQPGSPETPNNNSESNTPTENTDDTGLFSNNEN